MPAVAHGVGVQRGQHAGDLAVTGEEGHPALVEHPAGQPDERLGTFHVRVGSSLHTAHRTEPSTGVA
jgi:hypothetical protein